MDTLNTISISRFWNKHGVPIVWAVALLLLLIALVKVSWSGYSQYQARQANYQAQAVTAIAQSARPSYRVNDIVSANLFGDPSPKPVVKKAPKTTLDLTLQGILWASDAGMARAIIRTGKKKSELYSVGENIKGAGASIKEIRYNEVLLNRKGATESLPLLKKTFSGDRQLVTVSNPPVRALPRGSVASAKQASMKFQRANRARAPNGPPRKVRQPDFSGLDRALKKMGEL
ncbi:MAG: hypothetical protein HKN85_10435 [Gammaproteobacteria bacterium]|nr:hypothetical protein [Gammaproteobacteria bacterium]